MFLSFWLSFPKGICCCFVLVCDDATNSPAKHQPEGHGFSRAAKSNLSRTLKTMVRYGLVYFELGPGRQFAPRTNYSGVKLEMTFQ